MKSNKGKFLSLAALALVVPTLVGCRTQSKKTDDKMFTYQDISFVDDIGSKTNSESHQYENLKVNRVEGELRDDFAFGVDASMTKTVLANGGVYYNQNGQEQDVYQIYRKAGVNFIRFRLWNKPNDKYGNKFGGGDNSITADIEMAKKAKAANLNVLIDFHYSDFWADPDHQQCPQDWGTLTTSEIPNKIEEFTRTTLQRFKDEGVTVDAVQIGNETNNGLAGYSINWNKLDESFDVMAARFKKGISGAKAVFPKIKTIIHLANGGNTEEFRTYFGALDSRKVNYDIIGASYYPHLSGSLDELQENLNQVSSQTGKPVMVVETSWGFTDDYVTKGTDGTYKTYQAGAPMDEGDVLVTSNSYSSADENVGGFLTSEQAQATELRDICNVLSKVPNKKGLGIFYWEPGWLPVTGTGWATALGQSYQTYGDTKHKTSFEDGLATWSNQGLFSYTGKALASLYTYSLVRQGKNEGAEQSISLREDTIAATINLAAQETLPATGRVVTNFDAIRNRPIVWEAAAVEAVKTKGYHPGLKGTIEGTYQITCNATCIENYVVDPGFENQGTTDTVKDPWKLADVTPTGDKVAKIDRKKDIRSGKSDFNWYHSAENYTFKIYQDINLPAGTYSLTTYIRCCLGTEGKHTKLLLFLQVEGESTRYELDLNNDTYIKGWSAGYQTCNISGIVLSSAKKVTIGLEGAANAKAWGHNDDWELVSVD